ncbi:FAD-dependent oxidoreductase [Aurantiacibacter suaedae]|uniref:FAD-dependent oxidoreductase n=1 Tax=Aurantiacibacter suaedae TaxID=2545755 RepID=UPI0010F6A33D|nr:FAD-dependent oxidoreductase [Aurantiacibacter suaedae]
MRTYDVAIVGGGPAGLAAAGQVLEAGLSLCVIDEQQRPGGQILRQPPETFAVPGWLPGASYRNARALLDRVAADERMVWFGGQSVLAIQPAADNDGWDLVLAGTAGPGSGPVKARRVLVAGGCYDMPVAFAGWTTPGVMSAGGLQTLVKAQQFLPGERVVLFGTHPLMIVLAQQVIAAGGDLAAVCFAQPFSRMAQLALGKIPAALASPGPLVAAAQGMAALRKAGVAVHFGASVERCDAGPEGRGVQVHFAGKAGPLHFSADVAAMCYGFLPQSDLLRQCGAEVRWSMPAGGWEAVHNGLYRSSLAGLYVAGETTGVTGSDAAMSEGAMAGLAITADAGKLDQRTLDARIAPYRRRRQRLEGFIDLLRTVADPRGRLPEASGDTLLCRCEDIPAQAVDEAIIEATAMGRAFGASEIKLRCRAGMGLCQGRSCEHALIRRIAASRKVSEASVAGFKARFPVRPVTISQLIDNGEQ